jgi:hypothetical protein
LLRVGDGSAGNPEVVFDQFEQHFARIGASDFRDGSYIVLAHGHAVF